MSRDGSPRVRRTSDILPLFTKVATTSHYELSFPAMPWQLLTYIKLKSEDTIDNAFVFRDLGLLCKGAALPGTAYATAQINGNYMGINQKYAHTRIYTDASFTFMVDDDYRVIRFFELWQEFISSGSSTMRNRKAYYHRMQYPSEYKCDTLNLKKFDKNHGNSIDYTFLNSFPVNITPVAVSYDTAQILEISVSFAYDRYYFGNLRRQDTRTNQGSGNPNNPYPASFLDHAGNAVGNTPTVGTSDLTKSGNSGGTSYPGLENGDIVLDPNREYSDTEIMKTILTSPDNKGGLPKEYYA